MRTEAASAGFDTSTLDQHPHLQIVTVGELLDGKRIDLSSGAEAREAAPRTTRGIPL